MHILPLFNLLAIGWRMILAVALQTYPFSALANDILLHSVRLNLDNIVTALLRTPLEVIVMISVLLAVPQKVLFSVVLSVIWVGLVLEVLQKETMGNT